MMSDAGGASPGEIGGIVAAVFTGLGGAWAGLKWLLGWHEKRTETRAARNAKWEAELDTRERELDRKLEESLRRCEEHCAAMQGEVDQVKDHARKMRGVIELVLPELAQVAPGSPTLALARLQLRDIFPVEPMPADMAAELRKLNHIA